MAIHDTTIVTSSPVGQHLEKIADTDQVSYLMFNKKKINLVAKMTIGRSTDCDIVIDGEELDYISSSGLRIMLTIYKSTRKSGHRAIVKNLNEDVEDVFRVGGFLQLFEKE